VRPPTWPTWTTLLKREENRWSSGEDVAEISAEGVETVALCAGVTEVGVLVTTVVGGNLRGVKAVGLYVVCFSCMCALGDRP